MDGLHCCLEGLVALQRHAHAIAGEIRAVPEGGATPGDRAYLASKGVRVSLQGHQPFQAAVQAIHDTLTALRDGTAPADLKNIASNELMAKVTRSADYAGWTRDFLGGAGKG